MNAFRCALTLFSFLILQPFILQAQWTQTNGPYGGDVRSFALSAKQQFAGTYGGVFLSTNNGSSWNATALPFSDVHALVLHGPHLFVGTKSGVFLSTNSGITWAPVNAGLADIEVNVLTMSGSNLLAGTNNGGIFISANNGTSWSAANAGLTNTSVNALAASSTNLFAGTGGGVFHSTDNGTNWTSVDPGLAYTSINALAISGTNLFAGTDGGGYRFQYSGGTWTPVDSSFTDQMVKCYVFSGSNILAATADSGVFISTNNGTSWARDNSGLPNMNVQTLAVSGKNIFAGTQGSGVFLSTDNGAHWTVNNSGLNATSVYAMAVNAPGSTNLLAGTNGTGTSLSTDNGAHWAAINTGLTSPFVNCLILFRSNLFAGTSDSGIFLSTDSGFNWTADNAGLGKLNISAFDSSGSNLFAAGGDINYSTDNGTTWKVTGFAYAGSRALAMLGGTIFAGTTRGVAYSANGGASWFLGGLGFTAVTSLISWGTNLFAATPSHGVFLSTDGGVNWAAVTSGLTDNRVNVLALSGSNLFAGTNSGVFRSTNGGASWINVSSGMDNIPVRSFFTTGQYFYAGTVGAGVWRRPLSEMVIYPPISLTAVSGNGQVRLHWSADYHPNVVRYHIYCNTFQHPTTLIDSTGGGFADTADFIPGLENGTTYYVQIAGVTSDGVEGEASNEVKVIAGIALTGISENSQVMLHWSKNTEPDFLRYRIYGDTVPNPDVVVDSTIGGVADTSIFISPLTNGTIYYFRIAAVNSVGAEIDYSNTIIIKPGLFSINVDNGWNIVSVPLSAADYRKSALFPSAVSSAFSYQGQYVTEETLISGSGYWLRFNGSQYIAIDGGALAQDTVEVQEGWNLVGSISIPIMATQIVSDPGGIGTSQFFGYSHGYIISDFILPGKGYWVKVDQAGKLILINLARVGSTASRIRIMTSEERPPAPPDDKPATGIIPKMFALAQNYPNPFNPSTVIKYDLPASSHVRLIIYDVLGREVAFLVDQMQDAGSRSVEFTAAGLPSGIYFYRLTAGTFTETRKLLLLK